MENSRTRHIADAAISKGGSRARQNGFEFFASLRQRLESENQCIWSQIGDEGGKLADIGAHVYTGPYCQGFYCGNMLDRRRYSVESVVPKARPPEYTCKFLYFCQPRHMWLLSLTIQDCSTYPFILCARSLV